jgi:hypothetical protein
MGAVLGASLVNGRVQPRELNQVSARSGSARPSTKSFPNRWFANPDPRLKPLLQVHEGSSPAGASLHVWNSRQITRMRIRIRSSHCLAIGSGNLVYLVSSVR